MTAATGKPPEGEKKGKDKEKKDLPPCKVLFKSQVYQFGSKLASLQGAFQHILGGGQKTSPNNGC